MAWTDQCKYAFISNAKALLVKDKKRNVSKVLRTLSQDSGVPSTTLRRWWYTEEGAEKSCTENATTEQPGERMCAVCGIKPARNGKGKDGRIRHHTRCGECERKTRPHDRKFWMTCAHCGKTNFLSKNDLRPVKSKGGEEGEICQMQEETM
jgi:hypothetical protein